MLPAHISSKFHMHCQIFLPRDCAILQSCWLRYVSACYPKALSMQCVVKFCSFADRVDEKWHILWLRLSTGVYV